MKFLYLLLLVLFSYHSYSQVIADPSIDQVSFTNVSGIAINDTLPLGYVAQLNVPISNSDIVNSLPEGSCKIKIGLGTKMVLEPGFDLSLVNTSDYFTWTADFIGGQVQITGELRTALPANFSGIAKFNVQGSVLEYSTITTNFLVSNHNTQVILSDADPSNNTSFRQYKIIPPVTTPVNFAGIAVTNNNCSIHVSFVAENEINVSHYDIEYSKDGNAFSKAGSLEAKRLVNYAYQFPITATVAAQVMYIRIKSTDQNGSYKYSPVKTVNALCNTKPAFILYPNPVIHNGYVTVKVSTGMAEGKYKASLYDAAGRLVSVKDILFDNLQQFVYPLGNIASGQYALQLSSEDNAVREMFIIQKQ